MKNSFLCILDTSGSMHEMGKLLLGKNLVLFIREFLDIQKEIFSLDKLILFTWDDSIDLVELNDDCAIPHFIASGRTNLVRLKELFEFELKNRNQVKAIILSDGNFHHDQIESFSTWCKKTNPHLTIRTVGIGSDSSDNNLRKLSTNDHVFGPEDISMAMRSLCVSVDEKIHRPISVNDFSLTVDPFDPDNVNDEEDWD